jgi:hypothetical protein
VAFLDPIDRDRELIRSRGYLGGAVHRLVDTRAKMDQVYGPMSDREYVLDSTVGVGSLPELLAFVAGP